MTRSALATGALSPRPRARLLMGVSLAALVTAMASGEARAQSIAALRAASNQGLIPAAATAALAPRPSSLSTAALAAAARAVRNQTQVGSALDLAVQAQAAARAAAAAMSQVPNGLAIGGLAPAVTQITPAANDPTGIHTWQGALLPTANAGDPNQVKVVQTDARAILSWETFNVGRETTLTFQQTSNGVAQPSWVALNRVVGQINPSTGLRDPNAAPAPSQILGAIKADGTVLVINQNGVIFSPTAQVNVHSLIATSLEVGHPLEGANVPLTLQQRNTEFLNLGLLGYVDQTPDTPNRETFSAQRTGPSTYDPLLEGTVQVSEGATIESADGGFLMFLAPRVVNGGRLTSPDGQVSLQSGRDVVLTRSQGDVNSVDPDLRGLMLRGTSLQPFGDYVNNLANGIIEAPGGYVSLGATLTSGATPGGAVLDAGVLSSTTSVSRNGYVNLYGGDIELAPGAVVAITPDEGPAAIAQDPTSLGAFKSSRIRIGDTGARIDIGANSLIYAPSADISIGADPGQGTVSDSQSSQASRVFIDDDAIIDASGLKGVLIPASRNLIQIRPVKQNELRDTPDYRTSFLNGATVLVDPRLSGVRADGVAWVGSPLIEAASYYQQVGVTASELMTTGGNVTLGAASHAAGGDVTQAPDVIVKAGASIDISGGWRTFQAGVVRTSRLVNANGQVVDIAYANPNDTYVAVYNGFTSVQPRWGIARTYVDPLLSGVHAVGEYTEGRDAGALTVKASVAALDGQVFADAFPGSKQALDAQPGTGTGSVYGDARRLQAAPSQLPAGGYLNIQALGIDFNGNPTGGGDIAIVGSEDYTPVASDFAYGQEISFAPDGALIVPTRPAGSVLPIERLSVISLDAGALSAMGLSQLTVQTSGKIDLAATAEVDLAPGGAFEALSGRTLTIDGRIATPGGSIDLTTAHFAAGSVMIPEPEGAGSYDVVVNGQLNAAGRWANDFNASANNVVGSAYLNGGEITLLAAPRIAPLDSTVRIDDPNAPHESLDISGSILINSGSQLNVSGGGYVRPDGSFNLSARGGDVSLFDETTYFQLADDPNQKLVGGTPGALSGFRVRTIMPPGGAPVVGINPSAVNARVAIADGSILAHGFAGGGTFSLFTPQFAFGDGSPQTGSELPLDFFSNTGFAAYDIKSYKTDIIPNAFDNGLGGFNAVLATQVVTVGAGRTLSLTQSVFSPLLDAAHIATLRGFATGGDLNSILTPAVPADAWDRRAVNLTLGGLIELHVDQGGAVVGEAGGSLTVGELFNEGTIRIPGGAVTQSEILPTLYTQANVLGVHRLSDVFTTRADGTIAEGDPNALGLRAGDGTVLTNAQVAAANPIYLLGDLQPGEGVRLAQGSVTDLSGAAIVNPRAGPKGGAPIAGFVDGIVVAGGSLTTAGAFVGGPDLFHPPIPQSAYGRLSDSLASAGALTILNADPGSVIDLSGVTATFDRPAVSDFVSGGETAPGYAPTLVWSDGGALTLGSGGRITGADIKAAGGTPSALGGTLTVLDPILYQSDPDPSTLDAISADAVAKAGFDTFVAQGSLSSVGDVKFVVRRGVFVTARPNSDGGDPSLSSYRDSHSPVISSGGALKIDAAYIGLEGAFQALSTPLGGVPGDNSVTFNADTIDVTGAVRFDQSIGEATLAATGDVRLIGVEPWQLVFNSGTPVPNSLVGQLAVNGNLTIRAARVYPTTGTSFTVSSMADEGLITFAPSARVNPATPYSAGGSLTVQAAHILQDGVIRVPLGALTLGGDAALQVNDDGVSQVFAPATQSLTLTPGSTTSVSADGLIIPYGTTTDQIEWFFAPTTAGQLTAPPAAVLRLGGGDIAVQSGATVDLTGGGDVYAYEFVSGTGGSRDVLSRFNPDVFSGDNGFQYPDHRQVYAIVPGLSDGPAAPFDPIYSAGYAGLYGASDAGKRVYLSAAPGLSAGWYTLLPAQYALLPGGRRVVEDTGAAMPPPSGAAVLRDGTIVVAGSYGDAGAGTQEATQRVFDVQTQDVFRKESKIALTLGNATFAAQAAHAGQTAPRLPIDAGRLILTPGQSLALGASIQTAAATGGRGAQVDISGAALDIVGAAGGGDAGGIVLTAASLSNLNAASLLIGGVRTDNADGTTSLDVTSNSITVAGGAVLTAPEIILATDGRNAGLTIEDGASIVASGTVGDPRTGAYVIDGLVTNADGTQTRVQSAQGAFLRVANGPERLVLRADLDPNATPGALDLGVATLQGGSLTLESSGDFQVSPGVRFIADSLALGAPSVTFAADVGDLQGLVITPGLQTLIGQTKSLTIFTPNAVAFQSGAYRFGDVTLDAPGLADLGGGPVSLQAGALELANSSGVDRGACGTVGAPLCGAGALTLSAASIAFGSGNIRTYGFDSAVTLAASGGMFADGVSTFDAGPATLTLNTPFLGDRGTGLAGAPAPDLSLVTTGAVTVTGPGFGDFVAPPGTPGAAISVHGRSVAIDGAELRATAGALRVTSDTGLTLTGGARLETPGYVKTFGDATDPVPVAAPGGLLSLVALSGDIAVSDDSHLSVAGGLGQAGTLSLQAEKGQIAGDFGLIVETGASGSGASLDFDTGGAFDLSSFAQGWSSAFSGAIAIRSGEGDLILAAGEGLRAGNVRLTADGGAVDLAGLIDVSGVNGGSVGLYGVGGVHLEDGALIDAHADGYGGTDTRQAHGGTVTLGVDGAGAITVDSGAVIDVSARDPGNRLVPLMRSNGVFYSYVPGDQGGNLILRAPVAMQGAVETVPVSFAGSVTGANAVVLEGFQRFDLTTLANDPNFTGVKVVDGQAVLDLGAAGDGLINPLSDYGDGTVVKFVQDFDLSASYGGLSGLASQANFHARPGIELDYSGDIVLNSNWNLGAGRVDVAGAVAAGLMAPVPGLDGRFYVLPGKEADLFAHFTTLTYRVGGAVDGEPGVLTLRAGRNLDLKGSITDGFFQFRDQTDPDYLSRALAGGKGVIPAPYSAAANAPNALGSGPMGASDPLGSAELFPLLPTTDGGTRPVESWSYQLAGGAALAGPAGGPSADPLATVLGSNGSVTVEGRSVYCYPVAACPAGPTDASPDKGAPTYAVTRTLVRTGTGNIEMAASGDIDLSNGPPTNLDSKTGLLVAPPPGGLQLGGAAVYTAGHLAQLGLRTATDVASGAALTVDLGANRIVSDVFTTVDPGSYGYGAQFPASPGFAGILIANPVYLEGGGDVSLAATDVLGRRNTQLESELGGVGPNAVGPSNSYAWIGTGDQPWRTGAIGGVTNALINPQLFTEGVATLAGGNIAIAARQDVSDLSVVSTNSLTTGDVAGNTPNALAALSGGNIDIAAGRDFLGGRIDAASGEVNLTVRDDIASAGRLREGAIFAPVLTDNTLRLRLSDASVDIRAGGAVTLQGIAALGVKVNQDQGPNAFQNNLDAAGFYAPDAAVSIVADGPVTLANLGPDVVTAGGVQAALNTQSAVYPGTLEAVSIGADLDIVTTPGTTNGASGAFLVPSPTGTLRLLAAGDIAPLTIAMDDGDPSLLPGIFSTFSVGAQTGELLSGRAFLFPTVLPNTSDVARRTLHNPTPTHAGDAEPNRIIAGGDILDVTFSSPKQARISAGENIVNMVFFGQNLAPADITRIFAGRDITATTTLEAPVIDASFTFGNKLPAVQGNTFVVGGPGAVFVEAGRDAGPFLNSAVTGGFVFNPSSNMTLPTGALTYGGGILAVGNLNNPWLPEKSADIYTEFGVAKGQNFAGLESYYLSPANFPNLPDYLFAQATDANGVPVVDRNREIYAAGLVDWFRSIAPGIVAKYDATIVPGAPPPPKPPLVQFAEALQGGQAVTLEQALAFLPQVADQRLPLIPWLQVTDAAGLTSAYGTLDVTYDQAFAALQALPALTQREYLLKNVYFNELVQTSIPTSPSYLKYARGYQAVNTLFPGDYGYTRNDLTGGSNGANAPVLTGNLDLRLATLQTAQGGDIFILGPGGRVLAGSTVRTSEQAARRVYDGGRLFSGNLPGAPLTAVISQIPVGYEGVLTLRGGLIDSFTDGDFLLNQSRLFTEEGGDVILWSSNADLNAGQGPKTSANFPPIVVRIDEDAFSRLDTAAGVSGAGIAAFQPDPTAAAPDVALIAPRGTVDAGDAGVRSAGNVFIAALQVANADAIQAQGAVFGDHSAGAVDVAAQTSASAATAAAAQAAQAVSGSGGDRTGRSVITVDVLGYVTDVTDTSDDEDRRKKRK